MASKQVVVSLRGGMGNQMFQFAMGYSFARKFEVPLLLDTSSFEAANRITGDTPREFELHMFNLKDAKTPVAVSKFRVPWSLLILERVLRRLPLDIRPPIYFCERNGTFEPATLRRKPPIYLSGYWQSPQNFATYNEEIRQIFKFRDHPPANIRALCEKLRCEGAIALSTRRGDYVTNSAARHRHGVLGVDYYRTAIDTMRRKVGSKPIYIFTDDVAWSTEWLGNISNSQIVDSTIFGEKFQWKFLLMQMCPYHILANSTYCWWTAWLADHAAKIVIAPSAWHSGGGVEPVDDIVPHAWLRV